MEHFFSYSALFTYSSGRPNLCLSEYLFWLHLWSNFKTKHTYRLLITQGTWENNFYSCSARNKNTFCWNIFSYTLYLASGKPNLCLSEYLSWLHLWPNSKSKHIYGLYMAYATSYPKGEQRPMEAALKRVPLKSSIKSLPRMQKKNIWKFQFLLAF